MGKRVEGEDGFPNGIERAAGLNESESEKGRGKRKGRGRGRTY